MENSIASNVFRFGKMSTVRSESKIHVECTKTGCFSEKLDVCTWNHACPTSTRKATWLDMAGRIIQSSTPAPQGYARKERSTVYLWCLVSHLCDGKLECNCDTYHNGIISVQFIVDCPIRQQICVWRMEYIWLVWTVPKRGTTLNILTALEAHSRVSVLLGYRGCEPTKHIKRYTDWKGRSLISDMPGMCWHIRCNRITLLFV